MKWFKKISVSASLLDRILAHGGLFLVILQVTVIVAAPSPSSAQRQVQLLGVGIALVMNQIGLWHLASQLLSDRRHHRLRAELERFIELVRGLNRHAVKGDIEETRAVHRELYRSVDRMVDVAGEVDLPKRKRVRSEARS